MQQDELYMKRCLELAANGLGRVAPNPMVGCVIVNNGAITGEGCHFEFGSAHAEVNAINSVDDMSLLGSSVMYVNLEPCSHYGKTPPCADMIIARGIKEIVIGCADTNKQVSGKGIEKLKQAGCKVKTGVLENDCRILNRRFFTFHEKLRPYIILKWAETKDGYMARDSDYTEKKVIAGKLRPDWISNELAEILVHKWRSEEQAIMAGTETVLKDNPRLDVREWHGKNPMRIIIDRLLRIPPSSDVFNNTSQVFLFNAVRDGVKGNTEFIKLNFEKEILREIMNFLHLRSILSVIVEGGPTLLQSFIKENLWDEARVITGNEYWISGIAAPALPEKYLKNKTELGDNELRIYQKE